MAAIVEIGPYVLDDTCLKKTGHRWSVEGCTAVVPGGGCPPTPASPRLQIRKGLDAPESDEALKGAGQATARRETDTLARGEPLGAEWQA